MTRATEPENSLPPEEEVRVSSPTEEETSEESQPSSASNTTSWRQSWFSSWRSIFLGVGIGLLVAFGASRVLSGRGTTEEKTASKATTQTSANLKSVTVTEVDVNLVSESIEAQGTIASFEEVEVSSSANLKVKQVLVREGDSVRAGEVLATLDSSQLEAQLTQAQGSVLQAEARLAELRAGSRSEELSRAKEVVRSAEARLIQAKADLDLANKRVERNRFLAEEGAIAEDRFDEVANEAVSKLSNVNDAEASLRQAREQLRELEAGPRKELIAQAQGQLKQAQGQVGAIEAQLQDTRVVAPVSGEVTAVPVTVGKVSSGTLFKITENSRLELHLKVPETQLAEVIPGQRVEVSSRQNPDLNLSSRVREIDPVVDETSRLATVKVDLPNRSSLRPGMFLRGSIVTSTNAGLIVPSKAVLPEADDRGKVFVIPAGEDKVKAQPVEIGQPLAGEEVEIKSGLDKGDRIVVEGAAYLKDGDQVKVVEGNK